MKEDEQGGGREGANGGMIRRGIIKKCCKERKLQHLMSSDKEIRKDRQSFSNNSQTIRFSVCMETFETEFSIGRSCLHTSNSTLACSVLRPITRKN